MENTVIHWENYKKSRDYFCFCPEKFLGTRHLVTLLRRGSQLSSIVCFIIARVAADGPGPLKSSSKMVLN